MNGLLAPIRSICQRLHLRPKDGWRSHKLLVRCVAQTLVASKQQPGVNETRGAIAFDETGMKIDGSTNGWRFLLSFEAELDEEFEFQSFNR
jgi:hypothetical protein